MTAARLWRNGRFETDPFRRVVDGETLPEGAVLIPLARFVAERDAVIARDVPLGVLIAPHEKLEAIAGDLPRLAMLALAFPKFNDGRAFSLARLARERHGFTGELRAVGDILADRIPYMQRCGFDAFEVTNGPTIALLEEGRLPAIAQGYQPTGADPDDADPLKPWRRPQRPRA